MNMQSLKRRIGAVEVFATQVVQSVVDGHKMARDPVLLQELEAQRTADYNAARDALIAQIRAR